MVKKGEGTMGAYDVLDAEMTSNQGRGGRARGTTTSRYFENVPDPYADEDSGENASAVRTGKLAPPRQSWATLMGVDSETPDMRTDAGAGGRYGANALSAVEQTLHRAAGRGQPRLVAPKESYAELFGWLEHDKPDHGPAGPDGSFGGYGTFDEDRAGQDAEGFGHGALADAFALRSPRNAHGRGQTVENVNHPILPAIQSGRNARVNGSGPYVVPPTGPQGPGRLIAGPNGSGTVTGPVSAGSGRGRHAGSSGHGVNPIDTPIKPLFQDKGAGPGIDDPFAPQGAGQQGKGIIGPTLPGVTTVVPPGNVRTGRGATQGTGAPTAAQPSNSRRFDEALGYMISTFEKGYSNVRTDTGHATNNGITHATYDGYRRAHGLPTQDVRLMTNAEMRDIYRGYWNAVHGDELPPRLDYLMFDSAVQHGKERAIQLLGRALGLGHDAPMHWTPELTNRVKNIKDVDTVLRNLMAVRRDYYGAIIKNNPAQKANEKGWAWRRAEVEHRLGMSKEHQHR
jgi:hypothetical protein